ncbi:MAG: hypothetical protein R3C42_08805 [Parvularculaceae bacterium]|nr:hypothetical protein [Parvularculaceae bacterium]
MKIARTIIGFLAAVIVGFILSVLCLTGYTLAGYPGFDLDFHAFWSTFILNLQGLATGSPFAGILAVAFAIAFAVAAILKRLLKPLAPFAYVIAGAAAVPALLAIVENVMIGGGVGAFYGARGATGLLLQALAGAGGGLAYTVFRGATMR